MAQQQLNNLESAEVFRGKLNSNYDDLYSNKSPVNHASAESTYGAASNTLYGHVKVTPGNGLAIANGVVSMNAGSTSAPGAIQLINSYGSTSTSMAPTANALKEVADGIYNVYYGPNPPSGSGFKDGDIWIKTVSD